MSGNYCGNWGIKTAADKIGIEPIERRGGVLNVKFHEATRVDGTKLMALMSGTAGAQFTPAGVLRLPFADGSGPIFGTDETRTYGRICQRSPHSRPEPRPKLTGN